MLDPRRFNGSFANPCSIACKDTSVGYLTCEITSEIVGNGNAFACEVSNIGERYFTRSSQDTAFIGVKRTIGGCQRVVLSHGPDVSEDEIGLHEWLTIEITEA